MTVVVAIAQLQEKALLTKWATLVATTEGTSVSLLATHSALRVVFLLSLEGEEGFSIGDTQRVVQSIASRHSIAVGLIGGVVAVAVFLLIEVHH